MFGDRADHILKGLLGILALIETRNKLVGERTADPDDQIARKA
jgi:hypothetical protein